MGGDHETPQNIVSYRPRHSLYLGNYRYISTNEIHSWWFLVY